MPINLYHTNHHGNLREEERKVGNDRCSVSSVRAKKGGKNTMFPAMKR